MNLNHPITGTTEPSAATESKSGRSRARKPKDASPNATAESLGAPGTTPSVAAGVSQMNTPSTVLNASARGKFVLFGIATAERVPGGPTLRGFLEIQAEATSAPVKVNVAAWLKIGRASGTEYLSLKVGNNSAESPEAYTVGPFYGRLFREVEGSRTRYFGFVEETEKTGEDANGQGTYRTHWQLRINARPAVSNDGNTHYITGNVTPAQTQEETPADSNLPF